VPIRRADLSDEIGLVADMPRPCEKPDAILWHVAS
jgi:hypothetical protein